MAKKFNAFSGVFTPSILTILGVIMYMRLGWVVGQAGFIGAIVIIIVAHVISVSTGLSISSIATDKKIKTGGIYYMLSRSLGLPMGGAIGITLFIGTAFSIALYIIGFSETIIGLDWVKENLGLTQSISDYRLVGSVVLLSLVVLAFISTSLAIKMQYFVLAAIALSLVAIVIGIFQSPEIQPTGMVSRLKDGVPFEVIFGIFFPAVTGFTAGVAMSGDLKNPKKDIPRGTIWAIAIGIFIYTGLAILFGFFVNQDLLISDTDFLRKIAWQGWLVVLGISAATLSSALGGILGGPRILQAISIDKITPKIFAKGSGKNKEPRNALLLTFIIAEAGILIGELDAIARIVSIFYISAYGFINLSYTLESWASTDFRPTFKIPKLFGIIGFIACFTVMFQMDFVAMIIAFVAIFGLFVYLKHKSLELDFGDVWQSVWSSIVKRGLHKLNEKQLEERNWVPNMLLFSGGTKNRPYLIQFGKNLVGNHGLISNFDLHISKDNKVLFSKYEQKIDDNENFGVFTKRHTCNNIYDGIETIAQTYGFSGIEPNTVLLGWARESSEPKRFVKLLKTISDLDLNILMLDYDKRYGFGKYKQIDIWWRGGGNNGNLALSLAKFILLSNEWRNANVRLLMVNPKNDEKESIHKKAISIIENLRIKCSIKIINNEIEKKPFYHIIRSESVHSDLIILGIPDINPNQADDFIKKTNELCHNIGTVLMIKASGYFKELKIGLKTAFEINQDKQQKEPVAVLNDIQPAKVEKKLKIDILPALEKTAEEIKSDIDIYLNTIVEKNIPALFTEYKLLLTNIRQVIDKSYHLTHPEENNKTLQYRVLTKAHTNFLIRSRKMIEHFNKNALNIQQKHVLEINKLLLENINTIIKKQPALFSIVYTNEQLMLEKDDNKDTKKYKRKKNRQKRLFNKSANYSIKLQKIVEQELQYHCYRAITVVAREWGMLSLQYSTELQKCLKTIRNQFLAIENEWLKTKNINLSFIENEQLISEQFINNLSILIQKQQADFQNLIEKKMYAVLENTLIKLNTVHPNQFLNKYNTEQKITDELKTKSFKYHKLWYQNQSKLYDTIITELKLLDIQYKIRIIFNETKVQFAQTLNKTTLQNISLAQNVLYEYKQNTKLDNAASLFSKDLTDNKIAVFKDIIDLTLKKIKLAISKFPETIEFIHNDTLDTYKVKQYKQVQTKQITAYRLIDYLLQTEFIGPFQKIIDKLPQTINDTDKYVQDVLRLVAFSTEDTAYLLDNSFSKQEFIEQQIDLLKEKEKEIKNLELQLIYQIEERLNSVVDKLDIDSFIRISDDLQYYIKERESKEKWIKVVRIFRRAKLLINYQIEQIWYRQSKGVLLAKRIKQNETESYSLDKILNFVEHVSPIAEKTAQIPYYYKQLFSRKSYYDKELVVGRDKELFEAKKTYLRYVNGYKGGLLIYGDANSGKSMLAYHIANYIAEKKPVYIINPPSEGSISVDVLIEKCCEAFQINGSIEVAFSQLSLHSIVVFDDIELWWERHSNGNLVIEKLMQIMQNYAHKLFFVFVINTHTFNLINSLLNIDQYFLKTMPALPLNAEKLKEAVLKRHQITGFELKLHSFDKTLSKMEIAKLFAKHFSVSNGNIGITLQNWLSNIIDFKEQTLFIDFISQPNEKLLDNIKKSWYLILVQFILHKRLTIDKLNRITLQMHSKNTAKNIDNMLRAGLVIEVSNGVFEINPYVQPYITILLKRNEIL